MSIETLFAPIAALDLEPIKVKLMHEQSGEGWSLAYADAVEFEYRRFLYLMKKFPNEQAAPLFDVDVFWHYHILDTIKYAADCEAVFGYFLHHFPYVGLRGQEDLVAHHRVGERMRELYEQTYGEGYIRQDEPAYAAARGKVVDAGNQGKVAWSVNVNTVAWSVGVNNVAGSINLMPSSLCAGERRSDAPALSAAAKFYSVRPTTSRAA
jgi:hypothetical protein